MPPFMKPAFHARLPLSSDGTTIGVGGPYALAGGETDAYFWFRISQSQKNEGRDDVEVDVIGTHEREKKGLEQDLEDANKRLREAIEGVVEPALTAANRGTSHDPATAAAGLAQDASTAALEAPGPQWVKVVTAEKTFKAEAALAEGWLLMKSPDDPSGSNIFWTSKVTLDKTLPMPEQSPSETG
jgi:hypothetical protein